MFDTDKLVWKNVEDMTMLTACAPPSGGREAMSRRFTRHFVPLFMPAASELTMRHIFYNILSGFFAVTFAPEVGLVMVKPMVVCTVEVFIRLSSTLLPTPSKIHYTFNLRDVSKVFQV